MASSPSAPLIEFTRLLDEAAQLRPRSAYSATELLDDAQRLVTRRLGAMRAQLDSVTRRLRSVPATPNPWAVLGVGRDETRLTQVLGWLLDPAESHGLGDAMLRFLLLSTGSPAAKARARAPEPCRAVILTEFDLAHGRPDLIVVMPGLLLVGEVKIDAPVHPIDYPGKQKIPQTEAYRLDVTPLRPDVLDRLTRDTGHSAADLAAAERAFVFLAPAGRDPECDAYRTVALTRVASTLARASDHAAVSGAQGWALAGVLTQLLEIAHDADDGVELLEETRRFLMEPRHLGVDVAALAARGLIDRWVGMTFLEDGDGQD